MDAIALSRRNRLVALTRYRGVDDPEVVELRREAAADALARHIVRVIDRSRLTLAQRRRVVELLDVDTVPAA